YVGRYGHSRHALAFGKCSRERLPPAILTAGIIPPGGRTGFNLLLARLEILRITRLLTAHIDKPEPRGQALLAGLAIGAIYLALPRDLVVGPFWLFPTIIVALLVPSVLSHRVGKQSVNRILGIIINGITTLALIASLALLVRALPAHRESPLQLLR